MSEILNTGKCELCQVKTSVKCSACQNVFYCSKEHQKSDWKKHKKICKAYKICSDEILGRHLVTVREVTPNQIILKEAPIIWGPFPESVPVCLGCCQQIDANTSSPCSKCGWPVCKNNLCEKSLVHKPECEYTVRSKQKISIENFGVPHPLYQCVTILRCLYLKQNLPEKWKKLEQLESHDRERQNTERYENEKKSLVPLVLKFFKLSDVFTEEDILKVCGILMVNSHEVPLTEPPYIAIFDVASLLEHNCSATCSKSFTKRGEILISPGKTLKNGEHLSICYADPLWGTQNRRGFLYETKFFTCNCQRCTDSTEFGSYFNAVKCTKRNCNGYVLPKKFSQNSTDLEDATWFCNQCNHSYSYNIIQDILQKVEQQFPSLMLENQTSYEDHRKLIENLETVLHENHYLLTEIKFGLCQKIGQEYGLKIVKPEDLIFKAELCRNLDILTEKLIPAEKRVRGLILFELHAALAVIGRRNLLPGKNPDIFCSALEKSKECVEQVIQLLKFEPDVLPEGTIYKQAVLNLRDLSAILNLKFV